MNAKTWKRGVALLVPAGSALLAAISLWWVGATVACAAPPTAGRAWPVAGASGGTGHPLVLRGFEPPPEPWASGHRGVDLAEEPGTPVLAAAPGRVAFAGTVAGKGVVSVEVADSGSGSGPLLRYTYEPVIPGVRTGDQVRTGQPVGQLAPGPFHCEGGCLHWGLLRGTTYLDPLTLLPKWMLRLGPSRLLPVFGIPESRDGTPEQTPAPGSTTPAAEVSARAHSAGGDAMLPDRSDPAGQSESVPEELLACLPLPVAGPKRTQTARRPKRASGAHGRVKSLSGVEGGRPAKPLRVRRPAARHPGERRRAGPSPPPSR